MIKNLKKYNHYIYLYIFSCFALSLCSHFSPFYKYNFSCDPSIYLTIGRGIMDGLVPYKDLLDIKGPITFFLYAIFSPIKIGTNYFGIFILESIALCISVTFIYKTVLYVSKSSKWSLVTTLIYPFILFNQDVFIQGGEAEEFILPFVFILIYLAFRIINNHYHATKLQYLFLGFSVGFVFWIKYTCLGAWIAFYISIFIILLKQKNYKEIKRMIGYSFLGFIFPTILILSYFIINHALSDLLWGYFGWNYIYGGSTHEHFLKQLLFIIQHSFSVCLRKNIIIWFLVVLCPYLIILRSKIFKNNSDRLIFFFMTFGSISFEYIGGALFLYYRLMAFPFVIFTFCWIATKCKKIKIYNLLLYTLTSILTLFGILIVNPSIKQSNLTNYQPYQERFAKIILSNDKKISLLDFNELDHGWYNYLNIYPQTKHFNKMNMHYDGEYAAGVNEQLNIIKNKKVKYVICPISKYKKYNTYNKIVYKNYKIIACQKVKNDGFSIKVLLLERK